MPPAKKKGPKRPGTILDYHEGHNHTIDEFIQLKDAIEQLVREGHLGRYTQKTPSLNLARSTADHPRGRSFSRELCHCHPS